jgi:phage-related baseplate assembly protein
MANAKWSSPRIKYEIKAVRLALLTAMGDTALRLSAIQQALAKLRTDVDRLTQDFGREGTLLRYDVDNLMRGDNADSR